MKEITEFNQVQGFLEQSSSMAHARRYLSGLYDKVPDLAIGSFANARRNLTKTRISASDFINILNSQNLIELAKRAEQHLNEL